MTTRTQPESAPVPQYESPRVLLARYRVIETNTLGGFGTVSVCLDTRLQRRVAIKCMPLHAQEGAQAQASTIKEALMEARTSSMLSHPNIITVHDFESDDSYSYLVMEYVDGLSLAELLARVEGGVLTFDECAHLLKSVAAALSFAHVNGVLHLDIKPANIMIDRTGTVKLGDFGMAALASAAGFGGARGGTVGYMPPEQINGDLVDERTDIFSLAVVVWQALTGSCPFAARTPEESLRRIQHGPSPTLSHVEPDLAGIVEQTLLSALNADPRARTASVEDFADAIVSELGDVDEGCESLQGLLAQRDEEEIIGAQVEGERFYIPLTMRFPWLGGACVRLLCTLCAAWAAWQTIPNALPDSRSALIFGVGGIACASALWPPLCGAFGILAFVFGLVTQTTHLSIIVSLAVGVIGFLWWTFVGRSSNLSGPALLLPCCLNSPFAGVSLSGFALDPAYAFVTGAASWLLWRTFHAAIDVGFSADALIQTIAGQMGSATTWVQVFGCAAGALLCSLISTRQTLGRVIAGQLAGIGALVGASLAIAQMENTSIAAALDKPALAVALTLGATLCIAHALAGEHVPFPKGDDRA